MGETVTAEQCYQQHKELNNNINEIKISIAELPDKIMEKAETKFASKLTEKIVNGLCWIIIGGVVTFGLGLIVYAR